MGLLDDLLGSEGNRDHIRNIADGHYDGLTKGGRPVRDNFDGTYDVLGKNGKWKKQSNDDYGGSQSFNSGSGGCFITTAVCQTLQKTDNCEELTKFRHFRDTFMKGTPEMRAEVQEYYDIAPKICLAIDSSGNDSAVIRYVSIWEKSLKPAFEALESGKTQEAYNIYKDMVLGLKKEFLGEEKDNSDTNY